jgi:hypothetical protein
MAENFEPDPTIHPQTDVFQLVATCCDCRVSYSFHGHADGKQHWYVCPKCGRIVGFVNCSGNILSLEEFNVLEKEYAHNHSFPQVLGEMG